MIKLENKFTVNSFQDIIEECVHKKNMSYFDAIMWFSENHNIEIEAVAVMVKKSEVIKCKLEAECEEQNIIQRQPRLPI